MLLRMEHDTIVRQSGGYDDATPVAMVATRCKS